jgi:cytoskeleton protein RodZ
MQRSLDPATRLKMAREAKGLSCRQLAEITKLSVRTIESLEDNCISALPDGIYRRSIVKAVAREVGLNPDELLREFMAAHPNDLPLPVSATVVLSPEPSRPLQRIVAVAGAILPLLAGMAYFGWPSTAGEAPAQVESVVAPARRAEVLPAGGFSEASLALPRPVVVTLTISSRCELRIVVDGREILARVVEQGETLPIELGEELWLLGDNASAVQFSINGQAGRPLGAPGDMLSVRIGRDDYEDFLVRH